MVLLVGFYKSLLYIVPLPLNKRNQLAQIFFGLTSEFFVLLDILPITP